MSAIGGGVNLLNVRQPKIRTLHLTWLAFFVSFIVWFNHAPLMAAIRQSLELSDQEVSAILILNVALTIPARIVVGSLVDKLGPRLMYSLLLLISGLICIAFALADSFTTLAIARFLLAFVGAGFVVGIRLIGEWFPARETGLAQGIYAGFGNFGSAAAAVTLPSIALWVGGSEGWRWAIASTGLIAILYAAIYYAAIRNTPRGATYFSPKKAGAMEVTSRSDAVLYALMQLPLLLAMALLAWKLGPQGARLLPEWGMQLAWLGLAILYALQLADIWRINAAVIRGEPVAAIHRYKFRQVAVLNLAYFVTFGSELAVVSVLPLLLMDGFGLSLPLAGFLGASFGATTFFARPAGGWLSDRFGRRTVLLWCMLGTTLGYLAMSTMTPAKGIAYAVIAIMACSLFVNAGNGAIYAMLPMIKRRLTGQIAGMVGAFGNVGGVLFLTLYSAVSPQIFFLAIAATAAFGLTLVFLLIDDPKGQIAEIMPDGSVTMIDVR